MKHLIVILLSISNVALAEVECNKERALKVGMEAIAKNYPSQYEDKAPYKVIDAEDHWAVIGFTPEGVRGGGAPEAKINRKTCEVLNVSLAR